MRTRASLSMDEALLARMTGSLGDGKTITSIGAALAEALRDVLKTRFRRATGISLKIEFDRVEAGTRAELLPGFHEDFMLCEASVESWCQELIFAVDGTLVIALTEKLLGGTGEGPITPRALSEIERDVSAVLFDQLAISLQEVAGSLETGRTECATPFAGPLKREADTPASEYAATVWLAVEIGTDRYSIGAVVPQSVVLKTRIALPDAPAQAGREQKPRWAEQLTQKVNASSVQLQADVRLVPLSLGAASRLRPGDVIPFADEKDVRVLLKANGKNLFWCEFGKSGNRYMLQLQDRYGSEQDFIRQLTT
jgi:flagellar motor switch protein FliM